MPLLPGCIIFRISYEQRKSTMNLTGCVCLFWKQKLKHFLFRTHSWEQWVKASNVKHHHLEQFQCFLICQDCLQECHLTEKCLYLIYVFMSHFVQHCAQDWLWTSRSSWFFFSVFFQTPAFLLFTEIKTLDFQELSSQRGWKKKKLTCFPNVYSQWNM